MTTFCVLQFDLENDLPEKFLHMRPIEVKIELNETTKAQGAFILAIMDYGNKQHSSPSHQVSCGHTCIRLGMNS